MWPPPKPAPPEGPRRPVPARWVEHDRTWTRAIHRAAASDVLVGLLLVVSRLSNGAIWYAAALALPWFGGATGTACALRMVGVGLVDLGIYKILKRHFARPRPFIGCPGVRARGPTLDEHSFPSGHTLHSVGFAMMLFTYYPALGWIVWPFTAMVALSRIVLGLHYPSDVIVGALIGWGVATSMLVLF